MTYYPHCQICIFLKTGIKDKEKLYSTYCSAHLLEEVRRYKEDMKSIQGRYKVMENNFYGRSAGLIELFFEIRKRKFQGEEILAQTS